MALSRISNSVDLCALPDERPVYFGYVSALELARAVDLAACRPTRGAQNHPPLQAPLKKHLQPTLEQLELAYPALRLSRPAHLLLGCGGGYGPATEERVVHSCCVEMMQGAFLSLGCFDALGGGKHNGGIFFSTPSLAFVQMAHQAESLVDLLQLGFEICGTYQTCQTAAASRSGVPPLVAKRSLCRFVDRNPSLLGIASARRALPYLRDGSASPYETKLALLLGLPMMYGGYGLGMPLMNYRVDLNEKASTIAGRRYLLCDLCWPSARLDVEYQSEMIHANGASIERDSRRTSALDSMGWSVVTVTKGEINTLVDMDVVAGNIRRRLAASRRAVPPGFSSRQAVLRRQLGLRQWG